MHPSISYEVGRQLSDWVGTPPVGLLATVFTGISAGTVHAPAAYPENPTE